jgi:prepilin-type N-terminal cleavage/methylation domain-containing protein
MITVNSSFRSRAGFTLVELLIATAITALIVVMLGQVFSSAAAMWQAADQRIDVFRDARAALQLMAADLGRAHITANSNMLKLAQVSSDGTYAAEADAVAPIKNFGKSDLCTVEYYLTWNGTTKTYSLVRRIKDSDATIALLRNPTPDFGIVYDKGSGAEDVLAAPVWSLEFRPGETDNVVTPATDSPAKWRWLEIRFKAMSVNSARKLKSMSGIDQPTWADPSSTVYKTVILPYEQQFVTRVALEQNR